MLVDSISVAGLAGYSDAPIVLTPSGMLHGGVADFVEDYGVETVYVLGGAAAVSDSVVTALEGLNAEPEVMRISGDDRYATAAAIASELTSLGVDTVERIDGDSASAVSVALAELAANGCSDAQDCRRQQLGPAHRRHRR